MKVPFLNILHKPTNSSSRWTKNALLNKIGSEIDHLHLRRDKDIFYFAEKPRKMGLGFISTNSSDEKVLSINATVFFELQEGEFYWLDLFTYCKQIYGKKFPTLDIGRRQH